MNRFTDTDKWSDKWFRSLPPEFKLAWLYLVDNCDNAGVIELDRALADFQIGFDVDWEVFFDECGDRVHKLTSGRLWLTKFIQYQQKNQELNPNNRAHKQIISLLEKHGINALQLTNSKGLIRGLEGASKPSGPSPSPGKGQVRGSVRGEIPYRSPEFNELWERWIEHHTACNHGVPLPTQTDAQLMGLIRLRDEQAAVARLKLSLEKSKRGNILDPDEFRRGAKSRDRSVSDVQAARREKMQRQAAKRAQEKREEQEAKELRDALSRLN